MVADGKSSGFVESESYEAEHARRLVRERALYAGWEQSYAHMMACIVPLGFVADHYVSVLRHVVFRNEDIRRFFEMDEITREVFVGEAGDYLSQLVPMIEELRSLWFDMSNDLGLFDYFRRGDSPLDWKAGGYFVPGVRVEADASLPADTVSLLKRFCGKMRVVQEYLLMFPLDADHLEMLAGKVQERLEEYLELRDYVARLREHEKDGGATDFFKDQSFFLNAAMQISCYGMRVFPGDVDVFCKELSRLRRSVSDCRDELFLQNQDLVATQARKYASRVKLTAISQEDLFQVGCIGLGRALSRFQYRRGTEFAAYASWFVKQAVKDSLASFSGTARLPIHQAKQWHVIRGFKKDFFREHGRDPSMNEVASGCDVSLALVHDLEQVGVQAWSLDSTPEGSPESDLLSVLPSSVADPRSVVEVEDKYAYFRNLLKALPKKDFDLVMGCFGIGGHPAQSLREMAEARGVTSEAVRQQLNIVFGRLRKMLKGKPDFEVLIEAFKNPAV